VNPSAYVPLAGYLIALLIVSAASVYTIQDTWRLRSAEVPLWWLLAGASLLMVSLIAGYLLSLAVLFAAPWPVEVVRGLRLLVHILQAAGALTMGLATLRVSHRLQPTTVRRVTRLSFLLIATALVGWLYTATTALNP